MIMTVGSAKHALAQSASFSADDVADLIEGGIAEETIAVRALAKCITFRMTPAVAERFHALGATERLLSALGKVCYKGDAEPGKKQKVVPAVVVRVDTAKTKKVVPPVPIEPVSPKEPTATITTQYYRYLLGTRQGISRFAGQLQSAPVTGKYYTVETDRLGRMVRRLELFNGKLDGELRYAYTGSSKLPDSTIRYLPTGEVSTVNHFMFNGDGNVVSVRAVTPFGEVASATTYIDVGADRQMIDSTSEGQRRTIIQYSPTGVLISTKAYLANGTDYTETSYDTATGFPAQHQFVRPGVGSVSTRFTRDSDGTLTRADFFGSNDTWIGATEYADGHEISTRFKWPDGQTMEARPIYDSRNFERERSYMRNGTIVGKFVYDRYPNGRIKRTLAVAPDGQLLAEYEGLYVNFVEKDGHPSGNPTAGKIYKTTPWW